MLTDLIHLIFLLGPYHLFPEKACYDPGEVFLLKSKAEKITIENKTIPPIGRDEEFKVFLLAVDLFEKEKIIKVNEKKIIVNVCKKKFPVKRYYFPTELVELSPEDLERVVKEKEMLDQLWERVSPENHIEGGFILPVTGEVKYNFGERRFMNDKERSPHTGVDIYAEEGTPVIASQSGMVVFKGNTFFGGNSLVIDHGLGIYTMYFHLKEILVEEGKLVKKGETIGTVGKTGRATGPHLHWGVRITGSRADPVSLLKILR